MTNDIEKLIEQFVVPEMEVAPDSGRGKKRKTKAGQTQTVTIDEIPEVVLPKTKAQVYEEAKGRLTQKTSAVSRRAKKTSPQPEVAATELTITKERHTDEPPTVELTVPQADDPTWVGGEDELIPFAWRHPLMPDIKRPTKYYRQVVREAREMLLPVPHSKYKA